MARATFGAGCFWSVEVAFRNTRGVTDAPVGFMGGAIDNPSYEQICQGDTGHAEVVQVEYDPERVSYQELLEVFWGAHDPTQLNRQGPDMGTQYRSVIFFHSPEQEVSARADRQRLQESGRWSRPVVTEIAAAGDFHRADDVHQRFLEKRGLASCRI